MVWLSLASAAVPARAAELARSDAFAPAFYPIGFAGLDLLAKRDDEVLAFGPAGRRVVLREPELQSAVTADGTLALVRGDGEDELLAGPIDGRPRAVLRCAARQLRADRPQPAVGGGRVVWTTCDQRGLVVAEAGGNHTLPAAGIVRAVAVDGDRAAWVAAHGARPARLTVRTIDLRSGEVTVAGMLGHDTVNVINVGVAVARDGRLQATLEKLPGDRATCATLVAGQAGPPSTHPGRCPRFVAFTPEGSIVSKPASLSHSMGRVTRVDRTGVVRSTITTYTAQRLPPPLVTDGRRIALRLSTCRGSRLVVDAIDKARYPRLACPVRPVRREVPVSRAGTVRIRVRCRAGCLAVPVGMGLRLRSLGLVPNAESFLGPPTRHRYREVSAVSAPAARRTPPRFRQGTRQVRHELPPRFHRAPGGTRKAGGTRTTLRRLDPRRRARQRSRGRRARHGKGPWQGPPPASRPPRHRKGDASSRPLQGLDPIEPPALVAVADRGRAGA